jgi:hypothetical protein
MGEEGEATLGKSFIKSARPEGGRNRRSPGATTVGRERERGKREQKKKE